MRNLLSILIASLSLSWSASILAADVAPPNSSPTQSDPRTDEQILSVAQNEFLMGLWEGTGRESASLNISEADVTWRGCKTKYSIVQSSIGESYPDEFRHKPIPVKRYVTLKLKLEPVQCLYPRNLGFLQFSVATDLPTYAVWIELNRDNKQVSRMSFSKH